MMIRASVVWVGLLVLAFANGAARELFLLPAVGDAVGHALSSITLSAAIVALCWFTIGSIHPATTRDAWLVGGLWVGLTLAFEFLAGHYVFGSPWSRLWADYDVLRGRIWVVVLLTTLLAPLITARAQGLLLTRTPQ